jgi:predicted RNA-binding protein with RPS1 domain
MTSTQVRPNSTPQVAVNDIGTAEDFLAAIDQTIKYFNDGDIVEGVIVKVDRDEVLLDIGYKTEGVIPSRELSIKHDVDPNEVVKVGDEVEALVLQKEDKEGRLILSKKRAQYERAWGTIEAKKEADEVVTGTVIEVVKGGLILDIGLRGFLPPRWSRCAASATCSPTWAASSRRRSSSSTRTATTSSCPAGSGWSRRSPRSAASSSTSSPRARSAPASSPRSSTSARSSTWVASTASCTSPSCPGSTSTTRPRSSRSARRSPSRSSTSTSTASGSRCR